MTTMIANNKSPIIKFLLNPIIYYGFLHTASKCTQKFVILHHNSLNFSPSPILHFRIFAFHNETRTTPTALFSFTNAGMSFCAQDLYGLRKESAFFRTANFLTQQAQHQKENPRNFATQIRNPSWREITLPWQFGRPFKSGLKVMGRLFSLTHPTIYCIPSCRNN